MELLRALPEHLAQRTRALGSPKPANGKGVVFYLMQTSVRGHDNPALALAAHLALARNWRLCCLAVLLPEHPWSNARRWSFWAEGVKDAQAELRAQGLPLHLFAPAKEGLSQLLKLVAGNVVVTEDFPVPPHAQWAEQLATEATVLLTDCACVVPMAAVGRAYSTAKDFREATKSLRGQHLRGPPFTLPTPLPRLCSPEGLTLQLENFDVDQLVAQCSIDQTVRPIVGTKGGSVAGYRRWASFLEQGLSRYQSRRSDIHVPGSSRMSAYMHLGMVSPIRIARESSSAWKFQDELITWRELSFCVCRFSGYTYEKILPDWARQALSKRAPTDDKLPEESMATGSTKDEAWDVAQRALIDHGELHNNLRMYWGKQILFWTADAQRAWSLSEHWNNHYALDGGDPASYGGIGWAFGLFQGRGANLRRPGWSGKNLPRLRGYETLLRQWNIKDQAQAVEEKKGQESSEGVGQSLKRPAAIPKRRVWRKLAPRAASDEVIMLD